MKVLAILFVSALSFTVGVNAQFHSPSRGLETEVDLHGSILHPRGNPVVNLMVELYNVEGRAARTIVSAAGEFEFAAISRGQYDLRVVDLAGIVLTEQPVNVREGFGDVQIRLPETRTEGGPSGTISVGQLLHKVPSKARKEAAQAKKAWNVGDMLKCIDHLQRAIELDSEYLEARNELALVYVWLDQPDNVIAAFQDVLKLDPRSASAYSLIGAAYARQGQFAEAEVASRRALGIDSSSDRSKYVLGLSLAQQNKSDAEALKYLQQTWDAFPMARVVAAQVLARKGQILEARNQLEKYLPLAPPSQGDQVKRWLAKLKP